MKLDVLGVILQPFHENVLFSGKNLEHDTNNRLNGRLTDAYGLSSISGSLDLSLEEMNFDKKYDTGISAGVTIKYKFRKEGVLWVGEYGWNGNFRGESLCELFETGKRPKTDWDILLRQSQLSSERFAKELIQEMIRDGYFEEVEEAETGRKFLKPSNKK